MNTPKNKLEYNEQSRVWSIIREKYLVQTAEESVRQRFVQKLINDYRYSTEQMDEEKFVSDIGIGSARADIVIYHSERDKQENRNPYIVVECKAPSVSLTERVYKQGRIYASHSNAEYFVATNGNKTHCFEVDHGFTPCKFIPIGDIPRITFKRYDLNETKNIGSTRYDGRYEKLMSDLFKIQNNFTSNEPNLDTRKKTSYGKDAIIIFLALAILATIAIIGNQYIL